MKARGADGKWHREEAKGFGPLEVEELRAPELLSERPGIERELRVVRVGPNPRMIVCEYMELASRRTCVVNVGSNRKWMRGMKFLLEEPRGELEYSKPWVFKGRGPRRRGRW
jgi:hypothetical protein